MRSSPSTFGFLLATLALLILSTNPLVGAAPTNLTELVDSSALANSITDADFTVVARNFTGNPDTGETLCPEPSVCFKSCYPDRTNTGMCQVAYAKQDDSGDACTLIIYNHDCSRIGYTKEASYSWMARFDGFTMDSELPWTLKVFKTLAWRPATNNDQLELRYAAFRVTPARATSPFIYQTSHQDSKMKSGMHYDFFVASFYCG